MRLRRVARGWVAAGLWCVAAGSGAQPVEPGPAPASATGRMGFVRAEGPRLVLDGETFRFVGANAAITHGRNHRAAMETVLDAVMADGLRVVRVWALGEYPSDAPPWTRDYAWRIGPDGWVEESAVHLDRILDAARSRGLRVIVVLANRWADYGGASRYLQWAGLRAPDATGAVAEAELGAFFREAAAEGLYRSHVARVVGRVSSTTGGAYRDDPAVFAWELVNESEALPRDREALVGWTRTMARLIRGIDPDHMIAAGHIGYRASAGRTTWRMVQEVDEVSYADAHAYPTELGAVPGLAALEAYCADHAQLARHVVRKPMVWGEFGFGTLAPTHRNIPRLVWAERFLERVEADGAAGALVWIYTPHTDPQREHGVYVDGAWAARSRPLREVLARAAARMRAGGDAVGDPRLSPALGDAALWDTRQRVLGPGRSGVRSWVRGAVRGWTLRPEAFAEVTGEGVGRWDRFAVMHVYGRARPTFLYRLRGGGRPRRAGRVTVRWRGSSELPGRGEGARPEEGSWVVVRVDGVEVGGVEVPADDGVGRWVEVSTRDPRAVRALGRPGVLTLSLEVPPGPRDHGLCVYGQATGVEPVPAGAGRLPGRVEVTLGP